MTIKGLKVAGAAKALINVGCGAKPLAGWVNIDNSPVVAFAGILSVLPVLSTRRREFARLSRKLGVRYGSATRISMAAGSASVIYSSHMMEHLDRAEAQAFLREAHRVLCPKGAIRLVLPDLRRKAEAYLEDGDADAFVGSTMLGTDRQSTLFDWVRHVVTGPRHHLWMYDGESLVKLLTAAGFANARTLPAGQTAIAEVGLDLREREEESVYVEAWKP